MLGFLPAVFRAGRGTDFRARVKLLHPHGSLAGPTVEAPRTPIWRNFALAAPLVLWEFLSPNEDVIDARCRTFERAFQLAHDIVFLS